MTSATGSGSQVISELIIFKFEFLDQTFSGHFEEALNIIQLAATVNKISLIFTNVVIVRSTVTSTNSTNKMQHDMNLWKDKGPFSSDEMLRMMQYNRTAHNDDWGLFISSFSKN